ncbi:hypothetical protein [Ferrimonas sp. YFM]|uniref:hypothetical protein n=1 Tax=Ferrimonas sp. YFM TaxID=3028878 RepID=UPI0025745EF0|nr:hypothetical protein [Ferrimonas sp. YFM]BDY05736.1 hypothetical protein F0521_27770 [Ferrimonas sp. YFM]
MDKLRAFALALTALMSAGYAQAETDLAIDASSFKCVTDMSPVRGFYVDNLIPGKLEDTLAVANAENGDYPPGSVVSLIPTEVMIKHPKGYNAATRDWEFFELDVSEQGTSIRNRGFVDVNNRFGGNCFACHAQAKPQYDMICEQSHGCAPISITSEMTRLLQKTDPRCGTEFTPTEHEAKILEKLQALFDKHP